MKPTKALALGMGLALVVACSNSDDPGAPSGQDLTRAEASLLAGLFTGEALGVAEGQTPPGAAAVGAEAVPFSFEIAMTVPCPLGGEVAFSGSMEGEYDADAESFALTYNASQVHSGCAVDSEGLTLTITGNPGIQLASDLSVVGNPPQGSQSLSLTGGFDWSASDGRSGTCTIEVTAAMDLGAKSGSASGSVCGHSVDASVG